MLKQSLGTIEVYGLPAAIEAADVACKIADVQLIGYEATDGFGMVTVKVLGRVAAVQAAMSAAQAAAARVSKVFAVSIIPRPNEQLDSVVLTKVTVGLQPAQSAEGAAAQAESGSPGRTSETPALQPPVTASSAPARPVGKRRTKTRSEQEPAPVPSKPTTQLEPAPETEPAARQHPAAPTDAPAPRPEPKPRKTTRNTR